MKGKKSAYMRLLNEAHNSEYGVNPQVVATAPGRFHLIGENTWFFKDKTLSMAVDLPVYVGISRREDSYAHFYFAQLDDRKKTSVASLKYKKEDRWANALKAVIYGFTSGGYELGGMDITVFSEILPSAGFGVTTAIKVAAAKAIWNLFNLNCDDIKLIQVIERANKIFLQQVNHNADNFSALFAKKGNFIVTNYSTNSWDLVPFEFTGKHIFLVDAKVPRYELWNRENLYEPQNALVLGDLRESKPNVYGGWQYINDVTDINEELSVVGEDTKRKLLCVMREHQDVLDAINACKKDDFMRFARAVNHSHESLRDYFNLSCPEIDWILKRVSELEPNLEFIRNPVTCGRLTGKGFGRCLYAFIRGQDIDPFKQKLSEYERIFGFKTDCYEVHSSDGARIVKN